MTRQAEVTPPTPLRDMDEAAEFLKVSKSWLAHEVAARRVPCTRLGRRVLFSDANLAQIVERNTVQPAPSAAAVVLRHRSRKPA